MSAKTERIKFVILLEDEVRIAAKALACVFAMTKETPQEDFAAAAKEAMQACKAALDGAENDSCVLLLGRNPGAK